MPKLTRATEDDVRNVKEARFLLNCAREKLKAAGCRKAADRVRRAIDSADGAQRHVLNRKLRTDLGEL